MTDIAEQNQNKAELVSPRASHFLFLIPLLPILGRNCRTGSPCLLALESSKRKPIQERSWLRATEVLSRFSSYICDPPKSPPPAG